MRVIITLFIFLTFLNSLSSQSFEWIKGRDIGYEMNPGMLSYSVTASADGSIWQGGMKDFTEFYTEAMGDLFLARYSANGNLLQEYEITGSASLQGLEGDSEGNIYVFGQTLNTLHFWDGTQLDYSGNFLEGFLLKVSPSGTIHWAIDLSASFPGTVPEDLAIYGGHVYLVHSEWSVSSVTEFDGEGNAVRTIRQLDVPMATGIAIDQEGNVYVSGSCSDTQGMFGGVPFPTAFSYSMYLVKYSQSGVPQWVKFAEDITCTKSKVAVDKLGRIIWSGPLFMASVFDTLRLMGPSWGSDFFVTAFNGDGQVQWGFEVPQILTGNASSGKFKPVHVMPDNTLTIGGSSRGSIDWGNGVVTSSEGFSNQSMVLNISSDGQPAWTKAGIADGYSQAIAIDGDDEGNLYISGISHGTTRFDTCTYTGVSYYYPYLAKLAADLNTSIPGQSPVKSFAVYPNPAEDQLFVEYDYQGHNMISLCSLSGQEVLRVSGNSQVMNVDVSNIAAGVYLAKLMCNDAVSVRKVIIR